MTRAEDDVDEQVEDDDQHDRDDQHALHRRHVAGLGGVVGELPEALQPEDRTR